jgi:hypothetical protein
MAKVRHRANTGLVLGLLGRAIERDHDFYPGKTLSAYANEARHAGYIRA